MESLESRLRRVVKTERNAEVMRGNVQNASCSNSSSPVVSLRMGSHRLHPNLTPTYDGSGRLEFHSESADLTTCVA